MVVDIQAQHAGRSVHLGSILRAQTSAGRISLPVNGGFYTRFKHVQGIPSRSDHGYSLSKLQMIDLMVERLVRLRGEPVNVPHPSDDAEASQIVHSLARDLHRALETADTGRGSFAAGQVERGLIFSLVA